VDDETRLGERETGKYTDSEERNQAIRVSADHDEQRTG
jgi:hypothetical protein